MESFSPADYREEQHFTQWWLRLLILSAPVVTWWAAVQQLLLKKPFGNNPAPDVVVVIIWVLFGILFPWLFYSIKLISEIRAEGVFVRFWPFQLKFKHFLYSDIRDCRPITYRPIADYGGYGIRYGRKGKAYNISGDRGILLTFQNDKTLLIGSQKADELANAIQQRLNR